MSVLELHDETAFAAAVEPHRRELQLHCYRMLGSFEESEDLTQETFLRAWRRRETYAARASVRAWLYKIATNACLDALEKRPREPTPEGVAAHPPHRSLVHRTRAGGGSAYFTLPAVSPPTSQRCRHR